MKPVASTRTLYQHQAAVKRAYAADARLLADRLTGMLLRAAPAPDGRIDPRNETRLLIELGGQVQRFFVGENLRTAYAEDGMPQSAYAALLQRALVSVTFAVVKAHSDYLAARLPEDLKRWLRDDSMREQEQRIPNPIRLNPLAQYDPFHTWVDPRGYRLSDRIWQLSVRARTQIDQLVADGIRTGRPSLQIARDLEAFLLPGRTSRTKRPYGTYVSADAMRLARSEISRAHAAASIAAGRGNPFVSGFDWALSAQHPRIDICDRIATVGMSGERLGDPYPAGGYVPQPVVDSHPQCVTGDTRIEFPGSVEAATQSFYRGLVVEVLTARGHRLTVTSNHPVLTRRGWVAAHLLREEDEVLSRVETQRVEAGIQPDDDDVPARAEQIFGALQKARGVVSRTVPAAPEDFHGDGRFLNGDVHIVDTHGLLWPSGQPVVREPDYQLDFGGGHIPQRGLLGESGQALGLLTLGSPTYSRVRGSSHPGAFLGRHSLKSEALALAAAPDFDPSSHKATGKTESGDAGFLVEGVDAFTGLVAPDKVVQVRNVEFSGHVYNFQVAPQEWYIASGIITHNCLCVLRPAVTASEAEVIAALRQYLRDGAAPPLTPLDPVRYTTAMLGRWATRALSTLRTVRGEELFG